MSDAGGVTADQLRAFVERIEAIEGEIAEKNDDKSAVYAEAKANGFDKKTIRRVVALRKKEPHVREEEDALLDLYMHALGMHGPGADPGAGPAEGDA